MTEENIPFSEQEPVEVETRKKRRPLLLLFKLAGAFFILLFVSLITAFFYISTLNTAPDNFPVNIPITIEPGTDVRAITEILESENVVQSDTLLYYTLVLFHDPTEIKASTYVFDKPLTTQEVARKLSLGDFDTNLIRFTHIEGERATLLAERAAAALPNFDTATFLTAATPLEGRLFPDTYFVPAGYTDTELLALMIKTFDEKISPLEEQIAVHSLTLDEILVLASIIEREANTPESKKLVSSVLQNRLETGMPLQADASMEYVLNKPLGKLVPSDLKIESPYNTYLNRGLPPTPIGNPGLDAIRAVLEPTESEYYYYITGNDGEFYYAETYQRHLINIEKYLR